MMIRIVADDLTGALDAAAPFARADAPVAVLPAPGATMPDGSWSLNAETRGLPRDAARYAAERAGPLLRGADVAFRKIDSLLRGHVAVEIAASAQAGAFASVVVAPAFPAQGRVTRAGRHYARGTDNSWRAVEVDLAAELAQSGLPARTVTAATLQGGGTFLCDAETEADLAAIAAAHLAAPVLWCGSGGLARALAGPSPLCAAPPGPYLGIVATQAPATLAALEKAPQSLVAITHAGAIAAARRRAGGRLEAGQPAALVLRLPQTDAATAAVALEQFAVEACKLKPAAVFASGGDTLAAVVKAVAADALMVEGEIAPGIALSRIAGGPWNGVPVVSKSGAFQAEDIIMRLFATRAEAFHGQA
jgi:uncharacterized protein YgbK (DUF1537 family)